MNWKIGLLVVWVVPAVAAPGLGNAGEQDGYLVIPIEDADQHYRSEYEELNAWLDAKLGETAARRAAYWSDVDTSSLDAYEASIESKRRKFQRLLGVPDIAAGELEVKQTTVYENDQVRIDDVSFVGLPGLRVQGFLTVPKRQTKPKPAILCLHGAHGSSHRTAGLLGRSSYGRELAERGYVTFSPGMSGMFTDQTEPGEDGRIWGRNILHRKAEMLGWSITGIDLYRFQRCVDFLETLPDVDKERMGVFGISRGGEFALHMSAADTRMKATVSIGFFNDRVKKNTILPGDAPSPMYFLIRLGRDEYYHPDMPNYFGDAELGWLTAPRPLMIQNGLQDANMYIPHAHPEFDKLHMMYAKLGIPERAVFDTPDVGHTVDKTNSFPFLDRWLNHTPTNSESRSR